MEWWIQKTSCRAPSDKRSGHLCNPSPLSQNLSCTRIQLHCFSTQDSYPPTAGEVAPSVKCLPCRHEDLNLDPQYHSHHVKAGHGGGHLTPALEGRDRQILGLTGYTAILPASQGAPGLVRDDVSKKKNTWESIDEVTCPPLASIHTCVYTQEHVCRSHMYTHTKN